MNETNKEQEFKISEKTKRTFFREAFIQLLFSLGLVIIYIVFWNDLQMSSVQRYLVFPLLMFSLFYSAVSNLYNGLFMKITITEERIKFETLGVVITCKWSRLIAIEKHGLLKFESITVQKHNVRTNYLAFWYYPNYIPVHYFYSNWRLSNLGKQIKEHAPHLFE